MTYESVACINDFQFIIDFEEDTSSVYLSSSIVQHNNDLFLSFRVDYFHENRSTEANCTSSYLPTHLGCFRYMLWDCILKYEYGCVLYLLVVLYMHILCLC